MRSHVKVYFDFEVKAKELTEEEKGRLLLVMLRYAKDGTEPEMIGNERFLFPVFKAQIDEDIKAYETKVTNGSRGGRPVMNREPEETEINRNKPEITGNNQTEPEESEIRKKEERRKKKEEKRDIYFDRFWESYPRKEAKQTAKKAFEKLNPDEALLMTMMEAIQRFKETSQWKEENGRFIPHPATWLNQRRWEDDIPKAKSHSTKIVHAQDYEQRDYSEKEETMEEAIERLKEMGMIG